MSHIFYGVVPLLVMYARACKKRVQKISEGGVNFIDVMETLLDWCSKEELEFLVVIAKSIWFKRNTVVHGGEFTHLNCISQEAEVFLNEYIIANVKNL